MERLASTGSKWTEAVCDVVNRNGLFPSLQGPVPVLDLAPVTELSNYAGGARDVRVADSNFARIVIEARVSREAESLFNSSSCWRKTTEAWWNERLIVAFWQMN